MQDRLSSFFSSPVATAPLLTKKRERLLLSGCLPSISPLGLCAHRLLLPHSVGIDVGELVFAVRGPPERRWKEKEEVFFLLT